MTISKTMKTTLFATLLVCLCEAAAQITTTNTVADGPMRYPKVNEPKSLVLIRTYLTTNTIPGYWGSSSPTPIPDTNGMLVTFTARHADLVAYPPRQQIVTNYVLGYFDGTNRYIEVLTLQP